MRFDISTTLTPALIALATSATLFGATACQDVSGPKVVLTQAQKKEIEKFIMKEEPTPQHKLNVNFNNEIELIGFDVEPKELTQGQEATFTWYWKALKQPKKDWKIFIHFDAKDKPLRQGLDHHPVNDLFKTSLWKKGQIIKDVQTVKIREDFPVGDAIPYIGLYNGNGMEGRMMVVNDAKKTNDRRAIGSAIKIKKGSAKPSIEKKLNQPPVYNAVKWTAEQVKDFKLDGKLEEELWKKAPTATIGPFGKGQNYATWAKIAYTDDALYIAAHLEDHHIWGEFDERDSRTWQQEVFELFIDTNRDGKDYLELQVTPKNVIFDANFITRLGSGRGSNEDQIKNASAWNFEGMESAVHIDGTLNDLEKEDKSWTIEIKLPFANLPGAGGKAPADGTSWALNMYRFDRPTKEKSFAYAWSRQTRGSFHDVPKFGVLRFGTPANAAKLLKLKDQLHKKNEPNKSNVAPALKLKARPKGIRIDPKQLRQKMKIKELQKK